MASRAGTAPGRGGWKPAPRAKGQRWHLLGRAKEASRRGGGCLPHAYRRLGLERDGHGATGWGGTGLRRGARGC